jgi:hypothetical protein
MTKKFQYEAWVYEEIGRCIRGLFTSGISLRRATLNEDFGGVDVHYVVDHETPLALRCRFNRPAGAADSDITFRETEPRMIQAGTYAPLAVYFWFVDHHIVAGKCIDIYQMAEKLEPAFADREVCPNFDDGPGFYSVPVSELHEARALLKLFDGTVWATAVLGGEQRITRILERRRKGKAS